MSDPAPLDLRMDDLLAHASWVRRLALGLVGPDQADDLAQDVWLRALRSPPAGDASGSLRGWLRRVLVNRAHELRRGETRHAARERLAARPEALPDPLERLALHRELVERVAELDEPWRRTILLRYFEGLTLGEIAAREGLPLPTVNTRLCKGRELLRTALDARHGGRREAWSAVLLPFALEHAPLAPTAGLPTALVTGLAASFLAMKIPLFVSGIAAAALAAVLVFRERAPAAVAPPGTAPTLAAPRTSLEPEALAAPAERPSERGEVPVAPRASAPATDTPATDTPAAAQEPPGALVGRVVDPEGVPMAGLAVWLAGAGAERQLATSADDGSFPVDAERDLGRIEVRDARWGTVLACRLERGARSGPTLVVAPWITVGGLVRAEDGTPVEGAELVVAQPKWLSTERTAVLDDAVWHEPVVESDSEGRFALERTLAVEGTTLHVLAHGFEQAEVALPAVSTEALEIVLLVPDTSPAAVRGQVVDSRGRGIAGAWVSLGYNAVSCDANGGFRVDVGREGEFDRLCAVHPGYLPAVLEHPTDAQGESLAWPSFVTLQLGGPPLALAGRVIDAAGEPLVGWRVWLADPTFFSHVNQRGIVVEGMLQELGERSGDEAPSAAWPWTRTDPAGRFELGGLLEREYELDLYHEPSRLLVRAGPFAAGRRDAEIVVDLESLAGPVDGRVVDPEGLPLAGVEVQTHVQTYVIRHDVNGYYSWGDDGPTATTDDEGRFRFERLPRQRLALSVQHPDVIPSSITLGEDDEGETVDPDDVTLVCERRFHIKVETDQPGAASVEAYDESGEHITLNVYSANGHMQTTSYPLVEGKSEALAVSGSAHELALFDEQGNELARRVLVLEFGVLNQVRF